MVTEERLKPKDTAAALATVVGSLFSTKVTQPTTPLMTGFAEQTRSEVAVQGADWNWPSEQAPAAHGPHDVTPAVAAKRPATQTSQARLAPAVAVNVPAGHSAQYAPLLCNALPEPYLPAAHLVHALVRQAVPLL